VISVMCEVGQRQHHHQAGNEEEGQAEDLDLVAHLDRRHLDTRVERPVIGLDLGAGRRVPRGGYCRRVGLIERFEFVFGVAVDASE
jgi:hypothetical protein